MNCLRVGVVGCSTSGAMVALLHRAAGAEVVVLETIEDGPGSFAVGSTPAVSENHSGAEYPFDRGSSSDCLKARIANEAVLPDDIYGGKDYSLILAADDPDIREACTDNYQSLRSTYIAGLVNGSWPALFGVPDEAFELVNDKVAAPQSGVGFHTPQRGFNPARFAALLAHDLDRSGAEIRRGAEVMRLLPGNLGAILHFRMNGRLVEERFDAVHLCCNQQSVAIAQNCQLWPNELKLFVGLRKILIVDMDNGASRRTRLQLEGALGGMWSPMSPTSSLLYSPQHFYMGSISTSTTGWRDDVRRFLDQDSAERGDQERSALTHLGSLFPQCKTAEIRRVVRKVNINTVDDSRVRRNFGFVSLGPRISAVLLPKWTMLVTNALRAVEATLVSAVADRKVDHDWARIAFRRASDYRLGVERPWKNNQRGFEAIAGEYARQFGFAEDMARGFGDHDDEAAGASRYGARPSALPSRQEQR